MGYAQKSSPKYANDRIYSDAGLFLVHRKKTTRSTFYFGVEIVERYFLCVPIVEKHGKSSPNIVLAINSHCCKKLERASNPERKHKNFFNFFDILISWNYVDPKKQCKEANFAVNFNSSASIEKDREGSSKLNNFGNVYIFLYWGRRDDFVTHEIGYSCEKAREKATGISRTWLRIVHVCVTNRRAYFAVSAAA